MREVQARSLSSHGSWEPWLSRTLNFEVENYFMMKFLIIENRAVVVGNVKKGCKDCDYDDFYSTTL